MTARRMAGWATPMATPSMARAASIVAKPELAANPTMLIAEATRPSRTINGACPAIGQPGQGDLGDEGGEEPRTDDQPDLRVAQLELVPQVTQQGDDRTQRAHAQPLRQVVPQQSRSPRPVSRQRPMLLSRTRSPLPAAHACSNPPHQRQNGQSGCSGVVRWLPREAVLPDRRPSGGGTIDSRTRATTRSGNGRTSVAKDCMSRERLKQVGVFALTGRMGVAEGLAGAAAGPTGGKQFGR